MFRSTLAAFFALALATPAAAQTEPDPAQLVDRVDANSLFTIMQASGHTILRQYQAEPPLIAGRSDTGVTYVLQGLACNQDDRPGCAGLLVRVRYNTPENLNPANLTAANRLITAVKGTVEEDGSTLNFDRYVVLDNGVTLANIASNIRVAIAAGSRAFLISRDGLDQTPE